MLFKEIEQEDFDFDNINKSPEQKGEYEDTIRKSLTQADRMMIQLRSKSLSSQNLPSGSNRILMHTICEKDETESDHDEDSEEEKPKVKRHESHLATIEEESSDQKVSTVRSNQNELMSPPPKTADLSSNSDDDLLQEQQNILKETQKLKQMLITRQSVPQLNEDYDSDKFVVSEEEDAKSLDSVDRLWQQALENKGSILGDSFEKDEQVPEESEQVGDLTIPDTDEKEDQIELQEKLDFELAIKEEEQQMKQDVEQLITFKFPTSDDQNREIINLRFYEKYFKHQMHLAPNTDKRLAFMTQQSGFGLPEFELEGTQYYQELGSIGFYGLEMNSDNLISMLLITNCQDVREANNFRRVKSGFNNPQQYLVPDLQISQLRQVLEKIIQHLRQVHLLKKEAAKRAVFKRNTQQLQQVQLPDDQDESQARKDFLLEHADSGLMILLGKLYFHLVKYKQSLFSFNVALKKITNRKEVNQQELSECLLWKIVTIMFYMINKIRILKQYTITLKEQKEIKKKTFETKQKQAAFLKNIAFEDVENQDLPFDKMQTQLSQEIIELKEEVSKNVENYLQIEKAKSKELVLYFQLKLLILWSSPLYRKIMRMQSGTADSVPASKEAISQFQSEIKVEFMAGSQRESQLLGFNLRDTNVKQSLTTLQKLKNILSPKSRGNAKSIQKDLEESLIESSWTSQPISRKATVHVMNGHILRANQKLTDFEEEFNKETVSSMTAKLQALVVLISEKDNYIAKVAQSEVCFWLMRNDMVDEDVGASMISGLGDNILSSDYLNDNFDEEEMSKGICFLESAFNQNPQRLLASVKLWQFYRTLGSIHSQSLQKTNFVRALEVSERIQVLFENQMLEAGKIQTATGKAFLNDGNNSSTEAGLIVALMNARSLYDLSYFQDCFELLQYEFLKSSKYTGLLYIFGKYVIKANCRKKESQTDQKSYLGSGIGALEECMKVCRPELLSRVNYYIGLAYSEKACGFDQPLKAVHFWDYAKEIGFQTPYQGARKLKQVNKFLDQFKFFHTILDLIEKCVTDNKEQEEPQVLDKELKFRLETYLQVLTTFQEKIDGPSSLILKSYIYAYVLKSESQSQKCFEELIFKYPKFIKGYIEYWNYLGVSFKAEKSVANELMKRAKDTDQKDEEFLMRQAMKSKDKLQSIHRKLKSIVRMALMQSNLCSQTTTQEWVKVRVIAAKTYIIDKKFNKAINILTDMCYIIPPDMLHINADNANVASLYNDRAQGRITFCHQILTDDISEEILDTEDQDKEPQRDKQITAQDFHNRIFIDRIQENQMFDDFNCTQANIDTHKDSDDEKCEVDFRDEDDDNEWDLRKFNIASQHMTSSHFKSIKPPMKSVTKSNKKDEKFVIGSLRNINPLDSADVGIPDVLDTMNSNFESEKPQQFRQKFSQVNLSQDNNPLISSNGRFNSVNQSNEGLRSMINKKLENKFQRKKSNMRVSTTSRDSATSRQSMVSRQSGAANAVLNASRITANRVNGPQRPSRLQQSIQRKESSLNQTFDYKANDQDDLLRSTHTQLNSVKKMVLSDIMNNPFGHQNTEEAQTSIFAINSDVCFLYIIGKMCQQSGHNLKLGLQALNDYYLFMWHYTEAIFKMQNKKNQAQLMRNPLMIQTLMYTSSSRIKECVKTLLCIGQIYVKLNEPVLAARYFTKILEDRETLIKEFSCTKQVLIAEQQYAQLFNNQFKEELGGTIKIIKRHFY